MSRITPHETFMPEAVAACREACDALEKFGPYNSLHEAYAVLAEEVDELWEIVKLKQWTEELILTPDKMRSAERIRKEAIQIAAVALRIAADAERMAER